MVWGCFKISSRELNMGNLKFVRVLADETVIEKKNKKDFSYIW